MPRKPAKPTLAARLKELREAANLTSAELADAAGIDRAMYCRYEAGQRDPIWHNLLRIAQALGVSLAEFDHCRLP